MSRPAMSSPCLKHGLDATYAYEAHGLWFISK